MKASDVFWALAFGVGAYLLWEWFQGNAASSTTTTTATTTPATTAPAATAAQTPNWWGPPWASTPVQIAVPPVQVMYPGGNMSGQLPELPVTGPLVLPAAPTQSQEQQMIAGTN